MSDTCDDLLDSLRDAVERLESEEVREITDKLVVNCITSAEDDRPTLSVRTVKRTLTDLRRKRYFGAIQRIAEAFFSVSDAKSEDAAVIRLQLSQARIDQGKLAEAENLVRRTAAEYSQFTHIGREARGLLGRIEKQKYVNCPADKDEIALRNAVEHYYSVYREKELKDDSWWHGINVVACLARAERDGIIAAVNPENIDWRTEAAAIFDTVSKYDRNLDRDDYTFAAATALEACVALGDETSAVDWCERYITAPYADVFEMSSTERQLREVWQLDTRADVPGFNAMRMLQGRLSQEGGSLELTAEPESIAPFDTMQYQAQLGLEGARSVKWIENLFARCRSVAWIASRTDTSKSGTGFFVRRDRAVLNGHNLPVPDIGGDLWLITNYHVVNSDGSRLNDKTPRSIRFDDAMLRLTLMTDQPEYNLADLHAKGVAEIYAELKDPFDFTLIAIDLPDIVAADPQFGIPLSEHIEIMQQEGSPEPRLYVIGHPHGGVMKVSLYDNKLIEVDPPDLKYRSPTEVGNSGSPVLSDELNAVAIHQGTIKVPAAKQLPDEENEDDVQPANKGILLDAIADHLHQQRGSNR